MKKEISQKLRSSVRDKCHIVDSKILNGQVVLWEFGPFASLGLGFSRLLSFHCLNIYTCAGCIKKKPNFSRRTVFVSCAEWSEIIQQSTMIHRRIIVKVLLYESSRCTSLLTIGINFLLKNSL